ncbi:MAG: aminoglycoside N(3)-acetyltransferase [Halobacteriaceae archaeon]
MDVTRAEIRGGLRGLGLCDGDEVVVHASLSSLGWVEGGADAVVDALRDAVGASGTVMAPTFTGYDEAFDRERTPSETGAVTEALRTRPDAARSDHPTKSVAAVGPDAAALVADHPLEESLGPGSPMHRLLDRGGSVLLLGVDHTRNSSVHVAEKLAGVPYRDQFAATRRATGDGGTETVTVNRVHCSEGFEKVAPLARRTGVERRGRVGEAPARLLDGPAFLDLVASALRDHPAFLFCDRPRCERCAYAREAVAASEAPRR